LSGTLRVAAAAHQAGQLLHQVGVAAGPVEDEIDEPGGGIGAEDRAELGGDLPGSKRRSSTCCTDRSRSQLAISGRSGWRRFSSSDR